MKQAMLPGQLSLPRAGVVGDALGVRGQRRRPRVERGALVVPKDANQARQQPSQLDTGTVP